MFFGVDCRANAKFHFISQIYGLFLKDVFYWVSIYGSVSSPLKIKFQKYR